MGFIIARVGTATLLVWAIGRHPYGYYTVLRWVTCAVSAYSAVRAHVFKKIGWAWLLGVLAAIFNPLLPLRLDRETWALVDVTAALVPLWSIPMIHSSASIGSPSHTGGEGNR